MVLAGRHSLPLPGLAVQPATVFLSRDGWRLGRRPALQPALCAATAAGIVGRRWRRARVDLAVSALVALLWTTLTVGWWAIHFNPFPWDASLRNIMLLLPSILVPCMVFWRLVRRAST